MTNPLFASVELDLGSAFYKTYGAVPWSMTNGIRVEVDGNGEWDAPRDFQKLQLLAPFTSPTCRVAMQLL